MALIFSMPSFASAARTNVSIAADGTAYLLNGTISNTEVKLSSYVITADGSDVKPEVKKVGKTAELRTLIDGRSTLITLPVTVPEEGYEVSYFRILSGEGANELPVTEASARGEYKVVVSGIGDYSGSAEARFTVVGRPQQILASRTSYTKTVGSDPFGVSVQATGDGLGFVYTSLDPEVAQVSEDGTVTGLKPGRAEILVETVGDDLSQPARLKITATFRAKKVTGVSAKMKKETLSVSWKAQTGGDKYRVQYSTDKSFKKNVKTVTTTALKKSVTGLKADKTYYVRVCALTKGEDKDGNTVWIRGNYSGVKKAA